MDILSILQLFGGIGLFLYGMSQMSSSLEKLAGSGLERVLETLTTSKKKGVGLFKGWAFGTGVTGIMQSSAATTIMLIGFVNAGIMKVAQAIPVVLAQTLVVQLRRRFSVLVIWVRITLYSNCLDLHHLHLCLLL